MDLETRDAPPHRDAGGTRAGRGAARRAALVLAVAAFLTAAFTISDYGLVWDEPYYFTSQEFQRDWVARLFTKPGEALTRASLDEGWNFDPYHNPHPPFYRTVSNLTWLLAHRFLDPFVALRLAGPLWFAALVAGLCLLMVELDLGGAVAGILAAGFLATLPRIFAHAHFVATDIPIAALSVLATLAFVRSRRGGWTGPASFGVLLGMGIATKFSAFLIPIPLVAWAAAGRKRWAWRPLVTGAVLAPVVAVALNPGWWFDPIGSLVNFAVVSTSRGHHTPVSVIYWGTVYPFHAPWHEPWVLLGLTTPLAVLVLALAGMAGGWRVREERDGAGLLLGCFLVPLLALMIPSAPHHDGIRMFVPAIPFLCGFSALGFLRARDWIDRRTAGFADRRGIRNARAKLTAALAALAFFPSLVGIAAYHPHELSYYGGLIGGLRGAYEKGMEVTYWMEVFGPRVLKGIEAALPPGALVNPVNEDPGYFRFLQKHGRLRRDLVFKQTERPEAYSLYFARTATLGKGVLAELAALPFVYQLTFREVPFVVLLPPRDPPA